VILSKLLWVKQSGSEIQRRDTGAATRHRIGFAERIIRASMAFEPGSRLGPYEIAGKIGAGGMGEVFRARDTRLDRDVAIKILPGAFVRDADRVARFEREAKSIAALSHPNVLAVFDTGRYAAAGDEVLYVVTELLEGETLRERLAHGPLTVRKSIEYAVQVARGLAAAHEKGLVHRDLKPENIFLLADGQVKILDFGLARPVAAFTGSGTTETVLALTDPGTVMGTIGYMAPEQVGSQHVDTRGDVFALGAVLYEMLSGTRAFARETAAETMAAILREDPPDLLSRRAEISPDLDRLIRHCLEKNPAERFQSARDVAFALESLLASGTGATAMAAGARHEVAGARRLRVAVACAALAVVAAAGWAVGRFGTARSNPDVEPLTRLDVALPPGDTFPPSGMLSSVALAPDGRTLYYVASRNGVRHVYRRRLDSIEAEAVEGTKGATQVVALSDGKSLAFTTNPPQIQRVPEAGGLVAPIGQAASFVLGVFETSDGQMAFGTHGSGLYRTRAGGEPELVVPVSDLGPPRFPVVLPGERGLVFTVGGVPVSNRVVVLPAGEKTPRVLTTGTDATYVSAGYLVFWREGGLWAAPFDLDRLALVGEPLPVVEGVGVKGYGRAAFAVSPNGTLAYIRTTPSASRTLVWVDRERRETSLKATPGPYYSARLSPDNARVLLAYRTDATEDIWMHDVARGMTDRFVAEPASEWSANWSGDGERVLFMSRREGPFRLYSKRSNGLGAIEPEGSLPVVSGIYGRGLDGLGLLVGSELGLCLFTPATKAVTPLWEDGATDAQISPDGRWIAYSSGDRRQVWVRPYPDVDADRWRVATDSLSPRWSTDGRTLYYSSLGRIMAAAVRPGSKFSTADPVELFAGPYLPDFDVAKDGRFLMIKEPDTPEPAEHRIVVVLNWFADLKAHFEKR
jgi:Tol biopolymer transport system component